MLTGDQVSAIRELHKRGFSYQKISEEVGCSKTSIYSILHFQQKADPAIESARSELKVMQMQDEVSRLGELRRQREEREHARQAEQNAVVHQEVAHKKRLARIASLKDQILPPALRAYLPLHLQGLTNLLLGKFFQGGDIMSMADSEIVVFGQLALRQGLAPFNKEVQAAVAEFVAETTVEAIKMLTIEGYFEIFTRLNSDDERRHFWAVVRSELPELAMPIRELIDSRIQVRRVA